MLNNLKHTLKRSPSISRRSAREFFNLGDKARDSKLWSEAADHYRNGLAMKPDTFGIWVQLGHSLKENGNFEEAETAYLRAYSINPSDSDLQLQLGHFYSRTGQGAKAQEWYERAVSTGSIDPTAVTLSKPLDLAADFFQKADICRDARQWSEAAQFYQSGLERDPSAFDMWVQLGHVLKEMGAPLQAEAAYLRALELRYNDGDLAVQLGHLYVVKADRVRACDHYARSIGLGMRDPHALAYLTQHSADNLSLKLALLRVRPGELRRLEVLGSSDVGLSFAQFVLRYA